MISVEDYRDRLLARVQRLPDETVPLQAAAGRVLAADVRAVVPNPVFDNSAMDGFAVKRADVVAGQFLPVDGDTPAGAPPGPPLSPGHARRIMTGAPVPAGADAIVPVELTDQPHGDQPLPTHVRIDEVPATGRHIRRRAEDIDAGAVVLAAGARLTPTAVAALASVGVGEVRVTRRPRVAVIATGDELVAPALPLGPGQIPDSNSALLRGLLEACGAHVTSVAHSSDDPAHLRDLVRDAAANADVICTSGGVSAGAYDVLVTSGLPLEFTAVAMQPGKPQACGSVADALLIGLPGNPVSVYVSFRAFVAPVLAKLAGTEIRPLLVPARVEEGWASPPGRRQLTPVCLELVDSHLVATPAHRLGSGSHLVASLHRATGLAITDEATTLVAPGSLITVEVTTCPS